MNNIQKYILNQLEKKHITQEEAINYLRELQEKNNTGFMDIAIIGRACVLPMAQNTDEFWDNLINGRNCFTSKPEDKLQLEEVFRNPYYAEYAEYNQHCEKYENLENYVGAYIKDFDKFDAAFFGIPPREAKYIDPEQRIFLQIAWSAIEDAGYSADNIRNTLTGVFVGKDGTNTLDYKYINEDDPMRTSGTWAGILASRINYLYNLRGPAFVVDTACSSGLVAVHEACTALMNGDCEMAVAGGISIGAHGVDVEESFRAMDAENSSADDAIKSIVSDDHRVRTFDKKCSGTVFGEGCVVFFLKPLNTAIKDHDNIYGIIKGSAINNDGASNGLTAPNPVAQEELIIEAWKRAGVSPESINYVESHGTGTMLGDPIEVLGLTNAFMKYTDKKQFCGIGSVKTNIGHTVGAAGCANILKVILSMEKGVIPGSLNFEEPNTHIDFIRSPLYVADKNMQWVRGDTNRRAGISAFGFSGTNCHVIIEEPVKPKRQDVQSGKKFVLTLSAKTETSLIALIEDYKRRFSLHDNMNYIDICNTSNTGRCHYAYRVAICVDSYDDIKNKLNKISQTLQTDENEQIYFGKYKVVPSDRVKKSDGDITEAEMRAFGAKSSELIGKFDARTDKQERTEALLGLCRLYIKGINIDWNKIYTGENVYKVSLPPYHFDKIPYWGEVKTSKIKDWFDENLNVREHPLLVRRLVESKDESVYLVNFNLSEQWVLQEHAILGRNMVSGTTFIEICKEALQRYFNTDHIIIKYVNFLSPLAVNEDDGDIETHVVIRKQGDDAAFSVVSKHIDDDDDIVWYDHVSGTAAIHNDDAQMFTPYNELSSKAFTANFDTDAIKKASKLGPRWRCANNVFKIDSEIEDIWYTEVQLPDQFAHDISDGFRFHPATLDTSINFVAFQVYLGSNVYLPFSYKNLKIFSDLPKHFYSKVKKIDKGNDSEIMTFYVQIIDINGRLLAEIEEYSIKKVNQLNNYHANNYYGVRWIEQPSDFNSVQTVKGDVLIICDRSGYAERLAGRINTNGKIIFVSFGEKFEKVSDTRFTIKAQASDFETLISQIDSNLITDVYHFGTINVNTGYSSLESAGDLLDEGLYSFLHLTLMFIKHVSTEVNFTLVSNYAHSVTGTEACVKPFNTSFMALAKTTISECTNYSYRCIDFDFETKEDLLFAELLSGNTFRVAYRNNVRYVEELRKIEYEKLATEKRIVRKDGAYIITGGTGGLGLEVAKNFSELADVNLCIIGRKEFPEREKWESLLESDADFKVCRTIRYVREIESKGSKVMIRSADVSDYKEMGIIVDELKEKYGQINGIVHCAGIAGDGFLFRKNLKEFEAVINPKIMGTVVLNELTKEQNLDFFVMFSSIQSILGGAGQGDYTAGNSFLDTFSFELRRKGINAISINWPGWSETGMAVDYNVGENNFSLFKSIDTQTAINAFDSILLYGMNNIVPGEIRIDLLANINENELPLKLSDNIRLKIKRFSGGNSKISAQDQRRNKINEENLVLIGKNNDEYTTIEKIVALIYASVLNLDEIDIYESFNSMGGNSIIATEVLKVLNQQFNNSLNITDLFTYPCVEEMAGYIASITDKEAGLKEETAAKEDYEDMIDKFEVGDIDINSMIDYFNQ